MKKRGLKSKDFFVVLVLSVLILGFLFVYHFEKLEGKIIQLSPDCGNGDCDFKSGDDIEKCVGNCSDSLSLERVFEEPLFNGYIVEFKEEPVLVKQKKEKERVSIKTNQQLLGQAKSELAAYQQHLKQKQENFINSLQSQYPSYSVKINQITSQETSSSASEIKIMNQYTDTFNGLSIDAPKDVIEGIKQSPEVKRVVPNYKVNITLMDSAPLINADDVWKLDEDGNNCAETGKECLTGKGITIGIIDTGVDYTHEDLGGCFGINCKVVNGWDFINNDNDPIDDHGHGTHVASIAAGNGVLKGVAPDASIYSYKVLSSTGSGNFDGIIGGIERSADPNQDGDFSDHLDIISLSLGGIGNPDDPPSTAIDNVVDNGVVAVISAGNSGPGKQTIGSPGTARKAITIGATDKSDQIAGFSSRGPVIWTDAQGIRQAMIKPDVVAPGVSICAAQYDSAWESRKCLDDKHIAISGTSMAAPHVSGAVALLKQKHPDWSPEEIKMALRNAGVDLGYDFLIQGLGGRIDILKAVQTNYPPPVAKISTGGIRAKGERIDLMGSAYGINFDSYTLYYSINTPSNWNEIYTSNTPVVDGVLFSGFDTSILEYGVNYLKLVVKDTKVQNSEDKNYLKIDIPYQYGWPKYTLGFIYSQPVFGDIVKSSPGKEVIVTDFWACPASCKLYGFSNDGRELWSKNLKENEEAEVFGHFGGLSPVIGDINLDGSLDVVVGLYRTTGVGDGSQIYGLNSNGVLLNGLDPFIVPEIETPPLPAPYAWRNTRMGAPVLGDIDNDNDLEIIFMVEREAIGPPSSQIPLPFGGIFVINDEGTVLQGFPFIEEGWNVPRSSIPSIPPQNLAPAAPAIGDINFDGSLEIIGFSYEGKLYALDNKGNLLPNWPVDLDNRILFSNPVIGDIDIDYPGLEIVIGSYDRIDAYHADGTKVTNWPVLFSESTDAGIPTLADLDKDGFLEIIVNAGSTYIISHDGTIKKKLYSNKKIIDSSSSIADIDGDLILDLITGSDADYYAGMFRVDVFDDLYIWKLDGMQMAGSPISIHGNGFLTPAVSDIDDDGDMEIIMASPVSTEIEYVSGNLGYYGKISVFDVPYKYSSLSVEWPMFQYDAQHTGCYKCFQCFDGIDNDNDNLIDLKDPGCSNSNDNNETDPSIPPQCNDNLDNDNDNLIDYPADLGCNSIGDNDESRCGDSFLDVNEQCDDGNSVETDECSSLCRFTYCGDSIVQNPNGLGQNEQCDDGNSVETDECDNKCFFRAIPVIDCNGLQNIRNELGTNYRIVNDIDCTDTINWDNGQGFNPIGNYTDKFTGAFEGNNYKINGIYINRPSTNYVGLFGYVNSQYIKNIRLENVNINGYGYVGSLIGRMDSTNIDNSYSSGLVKGLLNVGGLVGVASTRSKVTRSYSTANVETRDMKAGGLIGLLHQSSLVNNSYAKGNVKGVGGRSESIGGLIGETYNSYVLNTYSTGKVEGIKYIGGLIGFNSISIIMGGSITASYWDVETSRVNVMCGGRTSVLDDCDDAYGKTTIDMKKQVTFNSWNFNNVWRIEEDISYPSLFIHTLKQCNDNLDNDNDGFIDYPNDPGCDYLEDDNETELRCTTNEQCDDGNSCTINECVNFACITTNEPDGTACSDNLFCTVDDACSAGSCSGNTNTCDDSIACTIGICGENTDNCLQDTSGCQCTTGETKSCPLQQGVCQGSVEVCTGYMWPGCSSSNYGSDYEITESKCNDGKDNDCDGLIDVEDGDCQTHLCTISSLSWIRKKVRDGDVVEMLINGEGCEGKIMNITIMEDDKITPDDETAIMENIAFKNSVPWTAEYQKDERKEPEYYFKVKIDDIVYESSRDEELRVFPTKRKLELKNITLKQGRNAISFPLVLANSSVEEVFKDVRERAIKIYTYDKGWKIYHFDGKPSNLQEIKPGKGYILIINEGENIILTINGSHLSEELEFLNFTLTKGWNLIGTFSVTAKVREILENVDYLALYFYNETSGKYQQITDEEFELNEEASYWIYIEKETTIEPILGWDSPGERERIEEMPIEEEPNKKRER